MRWHVYEDWTLEDEPRCFYVGKGDDDRVAKLKRSNEQHAEIAARLGHRRAVVVSSDCEADVFDAERRIIIERHTYVNDPNYNGIGCNRTRGGQGNSGRIVSRETRLKISASKRGKTPNKVWSQTEREATSIRMSLLHKGKNLSEEHLAVLRERMADPQIKQEMVEKVSTALREKYRNDPEFHQRVIDSRAHGANSNKSNITDENVIEMREEWKSIDVSIKGSRRSGKSPAWIFCQDWGEKLRVSNVAIHAIVTRKTWKHLP